jgi:alkyl hydroperoxide reductase subunit AhpC
VTANFEEHQVAKAPLVLSDFWPHGEVSRRYGVFNQERGMSIRSLFIIDADGTIIHSEESTQRGIIPDIEGAVEMVANLE